MAGLGFQVSRATVCLLGQPEKAIGHESQIEPWLAHRQHAAFDGAVRSPRDKRNQMTPNAAQTGRKHRRAQARTSAAANRGWMSEKILPRAVEGKCFYLTSPFIEPATLSPLVPSPSVP